jgi:hypothetical protein
MSGNVLFGKIELIRMIRVFKPLYGLVESKIFVEAFFNTMGIEGGYITSIDEFRKFQYALKAFIDDRINVENFQLVRTVKEILTAEDIDFNLVKNQ